MNICIVTSSYPLNPDDAQAAAGFFVRDFALELARAGHRIYVLTQYREGRIEDSAGLSVTRYAWAKENRPLSRLNPFHPKDLFEIFPLIRNGEKELFRLVQREKINFCLAMWAIPGGYLTYLAYKKFSIPYAVYALGSDIWGWGKNQIFKAFLKKILDNAQMLFADGCQLALDVEKISRNKCRFLPSARVLPEPGPLAAIDKSKTNFLFIGRYHKNKGVDLLIEAISLIPADFLKGLHFYIFGGGDLEDLLKAKVKKYGLENCVFLGSFIEAQKAAGYLSACDCLIIPSRIESIPVILSDSLQRQTPLIVTDVGDMGKLVREYLAGKVVKPENPQDLKNAIVEFSREDKEKYSPGIKELRKIFDVKKNAVSFLEAVGN